MYVIVKSFLRRPPFNLLWSELGLTGLNVKEEFFSREAVPIDLQKLHVAGTLISDEDVLLSGSVVHISLGLPGGKGGFGSMLRAIGAQIEKTTNREACRDLSGRRLRDINEEKRLKEWISKQAEREQDMHKKKIEKLERMRAKPKHEFHDPEYDRVRSELPEEVANSVHEGLKKKDPLISKRKPSSQKGPTNKKSCLWMGMDELEEDSDVSDEEEEEVESKSADAAPREKSESEELRTDEEDSTQSKEKPLDLTLFESVEQLKLLGEDVLASALCALGAKSGGTVQQRAERLWALKGKGTLKKLGGPPALVL